MQRLKVLFIPLLTVTRHWQDAVVAAIGDRHDLAIYDHQRPALEQFAGRTVVIEAGGVSATDEMKDAATDTQLWQIMGTGLDHVDIDYLKSKGFIVTNTPGQFSSVALGECALMFILMLARGYCEARANFDAGTMYKPFGYGLDGTTLGIIGFGASGLELARRAKPFGMRIQAIDVRPIEPGILDEIQPEFLGGPDELDQVVAAADYLSLHLHLTDVTRHIIDARRIGMMKPAACLINVARGALIDEAAMHEALLNGRIGGAGIDVFSTEPPDLTLPVYQLPNMVVTPHISGGTDSTARARAGAVSENVDRVAQGLEPLYRVDG
ncbi:MAG: NAD(P)-dependent oxidoreductase [Lentisphaeria bacterium]|jgi:D-3-phosphoglycerate dehydrogenase|nr:NAD(P)-dependent oxidoreductase [Lentisphaeria bacterium]